MPDLANPWPPPTHRICVGGPWDGRFVEDCGFMLLVPRENRVRYAVCPWDLPIVPCDRYETATLRMPDGTVLAAYRYTGTGQR